MTIYNKLVRDEVARLLREQGHTTVTRVIEDPEEFLVALADKLVEEAQEFRDTLATPGAVEELADVLEVVFALEALPVFQNLEATRQMKAETRGLFDGRIFLESVEDNQ